MGIRNEGTEMLVGLAAAGRKEEKEGWKEEGKKRRRDRRRRGRREGGRELGREGRKEATIWESFVI